MAGDLKTQIAVGVDGTGVSTGVEGINKSLDTLGQKAVAVGKQASGGLDGIGAGAGSAATKVAAAERSMINSIQRQIAVMEAGSKSGADYYRVLAGQRGIDTNALKPYLDQLDALNAKQKVVGVSAAQTAAAMRGVPAQFTDIVTSIQGGQAPLTVLLQQGGQLKDMFGGTGAAARALSGYVVGLINPFTLAAAAIGVVALAAHQGSQEMSAYSKALILTGGASGKTAGDLQVLASQIAATIGTQGQAADALVAAVSNGKIAAGALQSVGAASVAMSRVLGTSIEDAVGQFAKLADEPAKASAKLNETMHYLNASTYERIRALDDQGRKEEATGLAQRTYADATIARMKQVQEQSGILSKALSGVGDVAYGMWKTISGAISSVGAQQTSAARVMDAQRKVSYLETNGSTPQALADARGELEAANESDRLAKRSALVTAERQRGEEEKMAAIDRWETQRKSNRTQAQIRQELIDQTIADGKRLGKAQTDIDAEIANINAKHKDAKPAAVKAFQEDAGTKYVQQLREQESALQARLAVGEKLTAAAKELAEFEQKIADLKGKSQLTKDQKDLLGRQDEIRALLQQMGLLQKLGLIEDEEDKKKTKRAQDALAFQDRAAQLAEQIAAAQEGRREGYTRTLGGFGQSDSERQRIEARNQLYKEAERYQAQLTKATPKDLLGSDDYIQKMMAIKATLDTSLADHDAYYKRLKDMQGDWSLGASSALANYRDEAANVYRQVEQAGGTALRGLEDYFVSMATTGKASFKGLANAVIADIARMQAKAAVSKIASLLGGALSTYRYSGTSTDSSAANYENQMDRGVAWAHGGAFDRGVNFFAKGDVFDKPTGFGMAGGRLGVMGEAGPEAIVPLKRGADGKLGVAAGGGGGGNVTINNYSSAQVETKRTPDGKGGLNLEVLIREVGEHVENRIADNLGSGAGPVARSMEGRYGLRTAVS